MSKAFILLAASIAFLCAPFANPSATNTLTVGRTGDPTSTITITPTLSEPVKLECQRTGVLKDWYTGDPGCRNRVTSTEGDISTKSGPYRTLLISSFQPIHATTYSCIVDHYSSTSTVYPVVLANPSATNTLTVGRTDDPITPITITPTLNEPVKLECRRTSAFKDWFTGDPRSRVSSTEGEISTKSGNYRTLLISSFKPIHATTYSCIVDHYSTLSTVYPVVLATSNSVNPKVCITVGRTDDPTNTITITPTLSQPVKLECQRTSAFKDWFTGDPRSRVKSTEGEIFTKAGNYRTLFISSFQPIHATTYSCIADHKTNMSTVYPVVLETPIPIPPQVQGVTVTSGVSDGSPSLEVSWTAVSDESGITYTVWNSTCSGTETEPPSGASNKTGITGTLIILNGLKQGTRYYIWVAAVSSDGQGSYNYSTRVSNITFSVPGAPIDLTISPPPCSCDELTIQWKAPANTGGLPVNYLLYLNKNYNYSIIVGYNNHNNVSLMNNLTANTEYTVTVVAFNELGEGGKVTGTGRTRTEAPSISLSAISSTQLNITITAPAESSNLTYQCNISTTENDMPPIIKTGTELEYTVDGLKPNVNYTVKCYSTSSNGYDSCDSSDTIRMLCTPAYLISTNSLQQVIFTLTTPDGSYKCILSTNETNLSNSVGLEHAAIRCDNNHIIESASSNGDDFCDPCNTTMP